MRGSLVLVACAAIVTLAAPAVAHHSAAGIDRTKTLVVSGTVGVIAGIYPAWRASKLDPVIALTKA